MEPLDHKQIPVMAIGHFLDAMRTLPPHVTFLEAEGYGRESRENGLANTNECREGTTGRALPNGVTTTGGSSEMTVDLCLTACHTAGYLLAGVEYAGECCKIPSLPHVRGSD